MKHIPLRLFVLSSKKTRLKEDNKQISMPTINDDSVKSISSVTSNDSNNGTNNNNNNNGMIKVICSSLDMLSQMDKIYTFCFNRKY